MRTQYEKFNKENWDAGIELRKVPIPDWQKGLIIGTVLGDGCLHILKGGKNAFLTIHHSEKQLEYLKLKQTLFPNLFIREMRKYSTKINPSKFQFSLESIVHPDLTNLHDLVYKEGRKTVSQESLNYLTIPGLVLWFYDDGTLAGKNKYGAGRGTSYQLLTCNFTLEENKLIRAHLFKKFGLKTTPLYQTNGTKKYWRLHFANDTRSILEKYLLDWRVPCLDYKLCLELFRSSEIARETLWNGIQSEDTIRTSQQCEGVKLLV